MKIKLPESYGEGDAIQIVLPHGTTYPVSGNDSADGPSSSTCEVLSGYLSEVKDDLERITSGIIPTFIVRATELGWDDQSTSLFFDVALCAFLKPYLVPESIDLHAFVPLFEKSEIGDLAARGLCRLERRDRVVAIPSLPLFRLLSLEEVARKYGYLENLIDVLFWSEKNRFLKTCFSEDPGFDEAERMAAEKILTVLTRDDISIMPALRLVGKPPYSDPAQTVLSLPPALIGSRGSFYHQSLVWTFDNPVNEYSNVHHHRNNTQRYAPAESLRFASFVSYRNNLFTLTARGFSLVYGAMAHIFMLAEKDRAFSRGAKALAKALSGRRKTA